jgi:CRISPR system Cascade subunit CasC
MFVELHMLQNFAPSCLNRDDTNSPKDCEFGGYRRARISSQCLKRAVREHFKQQMLLPKENMARRTKRLVDALMERLLKEGRDRSEAGRVIETAVKGWGLGLKDGGKTEYLLFLGEGEIAALAAACGRHWGTLAEIAAAAGGAPEEAENQKARKADKKKAAQKAVPEEFKKEWERVLDGGKAADLALFGRMIADFPEKNIDAACQVAHAISTNQVRTEFDFYTAVDDLKPEDTAGADMMGTIEFNSACFYRYVNIDFEGLKHNLKDDAELARTAVEAFLRATVAAIPTGKQNSMAAHNPPSLVFAVVRDTGLWSLANAFVDPVRPGRAGDLVAGSIRALEGYWSRLARAYGEQGIRAKAALALDGELTALPAVDTLEELVAAVMGTLN